MASSSCLPSSSWPLLLILCLSSASVAWAKAGEIGIYWGFPESNTTLTNLNNTCNSGNFKTVSIAALSNFGDGQVPRADFGSSCNVASGGCKRLQYDIAHCQKMGIKVLLTVGGPTNNYTLATRQEAYQLAAHVYDVYLSGYGVDGPLGMVKLDGVDFYLRDGISTTDRLYLEITAEAIKSYDAGLILTSSLQCDYQPSRAMQMGLYDRVWPRFYDHPCLFNDSNPEPFELAVRVWTSALDAAFYVGLPTRPDYSGRSGYIVPEKLQDALQTPQQSCHYAGVMLWNRNWDVRENYSTTILPIVKATSANPCPSLRDVSL
ncbi:basic endochitinase-like [Nymphaea colorata]|uniref:basic endochitinase-like n=1 Tax=Nymphaea colorata TaxID=210225 RepID=UPI00129D53C2|nr:basic endochitinase-like [Nymphaea colorata]